MARSFNHRREKRPTPSCATNDNVSEPPQIQVRTKRGRTKFKKPRNGQIAIKPIGDKQFEYVDFKLDDKMKKGPMLGVILKRQYPPIIVGKNSAGEEVSRRHAFYWRDYSEVVSEDGVTAADRVKEEFWSIYSVGEGLEDEAKRNLEEEADCVFEKYAANQCKSMMYQARVDAVKHYYREIKKQPIKDGVACRKELTFEQYMRCQPDWFTYDAWESLSKYWCSDIYDTKRKRGQYSRNKSEDIAQNRGGSRPFSETQQYLKAKYGAEKATTINTYCCMKSGLKNCDGSGNSGPINSQRSQKRVDDYFEGIRAEHPDDWEQQPFDGKVMYNTSGGMPHGRMAIADGALKKVDIMDAAKASNIRPSNSMAYQNLNRRYQDAVDINRNLRNDNAVLNRRLNRADRLIEVLYGKLEMEIPDDDDDVSEHTTDGCVVRTAAAVVDGSSHASVHIENIDNSSSQEVA